MVENLSEVFGGKGPSIHWLLPTPVYFPDRELAYGYITEYEEQPLVDTVVDTV